MFWLIAGFKSGSRSNKPVSAMANAFTVGDPADPGFGNRSSV
jgi:hypothetical protein